MKVHLGTALRMAGFLFSALVIAGFAVAMVTGISAKPILSSSMAPSMDVGDLVLVRSVATSSLRIGDIPLLIPKGQVTAVAHRITAITPGPQGPTLTTRGDANTTVDAVHAPITNPTTTRVIAVLPKFGKVSSVMASRTARPLLIVGLGVLLTVMALRAVTSKAPTTIRSQSGSEPDTDWTSHGRHAR